MKYTAIIVHNCFEDERYKCEVFANNSEEAQEKIEAEIAEHFGRDSDMYSIRGEITECCQLSVVAQAMTKNQMFLRTNDRMPTIMKHILCLRYSVLRIDHNKWVKELSTAYHSIIKNKWKRDKKPFSAELLISIIQDDYDAGNVKRSYRDACNEGEQLQVWDERMENIVMSDVIEFMQWYDGRDIESNEVQQYLRTIYPHDGTMK